MVEVEQLVALGITVAWVQGSLAIHTLLRQHLPNFTDPGAVGGQNAPS